MYTDKDRKRYCTSEALVDNMLGLGNYSESIKSGPGDTSEGMPLKLYKYRKAGDNENDLRYLRQLLVLDTAYISNFNDFNDPFEGKFTITPADESVFYKKALSELRANKKPMSRYERRKEAHRFAKERNVDPDLYKRRDALIENYLGVLCLSMNPGSLLMWSHYASEHKGILLEYDTLKEPFFHLGDHVRYDKEFPRILLPSTDPNLPFFQKSIEWQYEEEFRIVTRVTRCGVQLQSACLAGLIFGARCSPDFEKKVRIILEERKALGKPIPTLKRARLSNSQYAINVESC